jgi:hypothetical protein
MAAAPGLRFEPGYFPSMACAQCVRGIIIGVVRDALMQRAGGQP